ncbi:MAG: aromatic acid/H+ symport family MFS transporter [Lautropia sp.]|nr:aromatic acid/H+ symport family MFS transporter [Lautropia sp.]
MAEQGSQVDVQTWLDERPFGPYQWVIFFLCFLIVLLDGFDTAAIGYVAPSLIQEWGVSKPALAPVLSAALFGLAAGALSSGPLADRFGRKRVLVLSVLIFGLGSLASAFATDLQGLTWLRFLTGLGLGAAMPNAVTLISEYSPARQRSLITNAMFCGFPLGASCGGFLAAWMMPAWGWRSVMLLGGVLPLVLVVALLWLLPESLRYMVAQGWPAGRIRAVLKRLGADGMADADLGVAAASPLSGMAGAPARTTEGAALSQPLVAGRAVGAAGIEVAASNPLTGGGMPSPASTVSSSARETGAKQGSLAGSIGTLFSPTHRLGSLMLWIAYFMGLVVFYSLINWMPVLFKEIGMQPRHATLITAIFPLGGVAAVLLGWLMDRYDANHVIALGYGLTAVSVWGIGQAAGQLGWLMVIVFAAGIVMNAAQASMPALAAAFYPTRGRATGVSWMLGIGRFGGIAGSFLVAWLVAQNLSFEQILSVLALPAVIAMLALLVKAWRGRRGAVDASRQAP